MGPKSPSVRIHIPKLPIIHHVFKTNEYFFLFQDRTLFGCALQQKVTVPVAISRHPRPARLPGSTSPWRRSAKNWTFSCSIFKRSSDSSRALNPPGRSVRVVLFFPDWHALLDFVDHVSTPPKAVSSVGRTDPNPHRNVAHTQRSYPMHTQALVHGILLLGFLQNPVTFFASQFLVGPILQGGHTPPLVVISHAPLERDHRACFRLLQGAGEIGQIQGTRREVEHG